MIIMRRSGDMNKSAFLEIVVIVAMLAVVFYTGSSLHKADVQIRNQITSMDKHLQDMEEQWAKLDHQISVLNESINAIRLKQENLSIEVKNIPTEIKVQQVNNIVGGGVTYTAQGVNFSLAAFNETYLQLRQRELDKQLIEALTQQNTALKEALDNANARVNALVEMNNDLRRQVGADSLRKSRLKSAIIWGAVGAAAGALITSTIRR